VRCKKFSTIAFVSQKAKRRRRKKHSSDRASEKKNETKTRPERNRAPCSYASLGLASLESLEKEKFFGRRYWFGFSDIERNFFLFFFVFVSRRS
jgi:hypothetical protein